MCNDAVMKGDTGTNPLWGINNRFVIDGAKLSAARMAADMSMETVAAALGCNKSSVSRWEQGILVPSEERIFKMAEMFNTMAFVVGNPNFGKKQIRNGGSNGN
jgi:transcriptional regulator with XRE-family HTH domain